MNVDKILKSKRLTSALTGLTPQEFLNLLSPFAQTWQDLKQEDYQKNRKQRKRKLSGGRKGSLREMEDKLLFILFYYKCYPTYGVLSFLYGFDRANGFRRQEQITKVLEKTPRKKLCYLKEN